MEYRFRTSSLAAEVMTELSAQLERYQYDVIPVRREIVMRAALLAGAASEYLMSEENLDEATISLQNSFGPVTK